jgi:hypothetical protein
MTPLSSPYLVAKVRSTRKRAYALIVLLPLLATLVLPSLSDKARSAAAPNGVPRPKQGLYFGTWAKPFGSESKQQALTDMESQIGRRFALDHQYYQWNAAIPTNHETWTRSQGRIPFITWHAGPSWAAIASGQEDGWIRSRADALRAFETPVYLTFHHEPENDVGAKGTPAEFAAAFRHVVSVFRDRGATNVSFVWTMMAWSFESSEADRFYPGDGSVDVVGADGYNWSPGRQGADWRSFRDVMAETRAFSVAHGKPFMAAELGVQEDPNDPGRKGQWYRETVATAESWPELIAIAYFDSDKIYGWMPDTSSRSLDGFRTLANSGVASPMLGATEAPGSPPAPGPGPAPRPLTDPVHVRVLRSSGFLRADGRVGISVQGSCDPDLAAFELDVSLRQGEVVGSVSIVQAGVITCDDQPHNVRVKISPERGRFRHGRVTVDAFLGAFSQTEGDLEDTASTTVPI